MTMRSSFILGVVFAITGCGGSNGLSSSSGGGAGSAGGTGPLASAGAAAGGAGGIPSLGGTTTTSEGGAGNSGTQASSPGGTPSSGAGRTSTAGTVSGGNTAGTTPVPGGAGGTVTGGTGLGGVATTGTAGTGSAGRSATGGATTGGKPTTGGTATTGTPSGGGVIGGNTATGATGGATGTSSIPAACMPAPLSGDNTSYCNQNTTGTPYGNFKWRFWGDKATACLTTFSDGAFRASWDNAGTVMAGVGLQFTDGKTYQQLSTAAVDFAESKTGSVGSYSYIGVFGQTAKPNVEFFVVEDSYSAMPVKPKGTQMGTLVTDGGTYDIFKYEPRVAGDPLTLFYSVRRTGRTCGHVTLSDHFAKWTELGMPLGQITEVDVLIEAAGGTGSIDFSTVKITVN